ncbi:DUF2735 domain-containing protein [Rhizobium terrae]|uniref:DUF2735 domain-containing protein n=1 Tax=Rhizobium terrae TaxID=2171756 RepID=UPI000E3D66F5|nr:DUF2735 domain-containing protein [Rhizobium terrae]
MTTNIHRETAKVYQFPIRQRVRLDNGRTLPTGIYDVAPAVVDTNCWYHDEAVRESTKTDRPKPC